MNNIMVFEPATFDEATKTADAVMSGSAAVVNLHRLDRGTAQRYTDFLTGMVYALNGKIEMPGNNVLLCVPHESDISGSIKL